MRVDNLNADEQTSSELTQGQHPKAEIGPDSRSGSNSDGPSRQAVIGSLFLFAAVFALSWLAATGWQNRTLIANLFYESSLEKYNVAAGLSGPATFLVHHSSFAALEALTRENDQILGIEMTKKSGVAAMAFTSHDVAAIDTVRALPVVGNMIRKNIPMLCH